MYASNFFCERCQLSPKIFFEKLRMIEIGPRGRWKRSTIFQTSHPSQKSMLSKALSLWKKNPICQIFHQKNFQKVLMKINEKADIFSNSVNFAQNALYRFTDVLNLSLLYSIIAFLLATVHYGNTGCGVFLQGVQN